MDNMRNILLNSLLFALIVGFSLWLYTYDEAAKPGELHSSHEFISDCETCHVPWRGVTDKMCRKCHHFAEIDPSDNTKPSFEKVANCTQCNELVDPDSLKPQIRFHEAEKNCLQCHTEHNGHAADISDVDHTLFNPDLSCTRCHLDAHDGKLGKTCRSCHGISTWTVEGFVHPASNNRNCHRCHEAPRSHKKKLFWKEIQKEHQLSIDTEDPPSVEDCWRCHTIHRWDHMRMDHEL